MPGSYWKDSICQLNSNLDKCREHVEALNNQDMSLRKEIYNTPNTLVEVSIKTKKKEHQPKATVPSFSKHKKLPAKINNHAARRKPLSSKTHKPISTTDEVDSSGRAFFQNRTLRAVLGEIKSVLSSGEVHQALDLLGDVEYIALNLDGHGRPQLSAPTCDKSRETEKLQKELEGCRSKCQELTLSDESKNKQMEELKSMVSRLSTNNQNMVLVLKDKVRSEESLKIANKDLISALNQEREVNSKFLSQVKEKEMEIKRLQRIIDDLKFTLSHDLEELENSRKRIPEIPPNLTLSPDNTGLMTTTVMTEPSERSEPTSFSDSAIDEGIVSESVATKTEEIPVSSFQPEKLNLSDTRDDEVAVDYDAAIKTARAAMDNKVKDFLERMKEKARLSVSIPEIRLRGDQQQHFDEPSINIDMTEDSIQNLSENKFRQGLESSLYLSSCESTT